MDLLQDRSRSHGLIEPPLCPRSRRCPLSPAVAPAGAPHCACSPPHPNSCPHCYVQQLACLIVRMSLLSGPKQAATPRGMLSAAVPAGTLLRPAVLQHIRCAGRVRVEVQAGGAGGGYGGGATGHASGRDSGRLGEGGRWSCWRRSSCLAESQVSRGMGWRGLCSESVRTPPNIVLAESHFLPVACPWNSSGRQGGPARSPSCPVSSLGRPAGSTSGS